ncbi:DUF6095 family protein [Flavobacterium sp. '19STA2R22 D10 B1']|uniref:DUF6095 family protein n=1 Tax=Flavobacterium aerium TaxID=3037261 RepID=UPI00278BEA8E|nr:DUF6095 family protein [Flavobacterium sp. '19STA2R22 D10 B1']
MPTDKKILAKGIKYLGWALPLLFIGPVVIHSAFKNQGNTLYWIVLCVGIAICITSASLLFYGVRTVVKSMFDSK